jgi:hypothetical protein
MFDLIVVGQVDEEALEYFVNEISGNLRLVGHILWDAN